MKKSYKLFLHFFSLALFATLVFVVGFVTNFDIKNFSFGQKKSPNSNTKNDNLFVISCAKVALADAPYAEGAYYAEGGYGGDGSDGGGSCDGGGGGGGGGDC